MPPPGGMQPPQNQAAFIGKVKHETPTEIIV